jgi:hypothetical protein
MRLEVQTLNGKQANGRVRPRSLFCQRKMLVYGGGMNQADIQFCQVWPPARSALIDHRSVCHHSPLKTPVFYSAQSTDSAPHVSTNIFISLTSTVHISVPKYNIFKGHGAVS